MDEKLQNLTERIFLKTWRPFAWIAGMIFIVYFTTLFSGIVYLDDNVLVVNNYVYNKNLSNLPHTFVEDIFRSPAGTGSFYRPVLRQSFMFDAQFGQNSVIFMSHLSNLVMHVLAIILLFIFIQKLNVRKDLAFLFSIFFGIHPLTSQTVAFIPGRNDSLLAIFVFLSLILFLKYIESKKWKYLFAHILFMTIALFTKETGAVLPFVCISYLAIFIGYKQIWIDLRKYIWLLVGWAISFSGYFVMRHLVLKTFVGNADYHVIPAIYNNIPSLLPTIGKIFLPFELSVFPILKDMTMVYGILSLLLIAIWCLLTKNKAYKYILFGSSWFILFILLTLIKPTDTTPEFSENRIYIPMFGFIFILLGLGSIELKNFVYKKYLLIAGILIPILILSSITIYRNKYYSNNISFWINATETSPSSAFNHNNLGAMYFLDNKYDQAKAEFIKTLEINPSEKLTNNNLGLIYMNSGDFAKSEQSFVNEIKINPLYDNAYSNLGLLFFKTNKLEYAEELWLKTIEINPNNTDALYNLMFLYNSQKNTDKANYYKIQLEKLGY